MPVHSVRELPDYFKWYVITTIHRPLKIEMVVSREPWSGQVCKRWERLFRVFPESE